MRLEILTVVGENCVTIEDGEMVYELIYPELAAGHPVELDFSGACVFASTFFNPAIGRLLKDFTDEQLNRLITVTNITPVGRDALRRVIEHSARYYRDDAYRKALDEIILEQAETV